MSFLYMNVMKPFRSIKLIEFNDCRQPKRVSDVFFEDLIKGRHKADLFAAAYVKGIVAWIFWSWFFLQSWEGPVDNSAEDQGRLDCNSVEIGNELLYDKLDGFVVILFHVFVHFGSDVFAGKEVLFVERLELLDS